MLRSFGKSLLPWLVPLLLLAVWQISVQAGWVSRRVLPTPLEVLQAGVTLTLNGRLFEHLEISFRRASLGFLLGGSVGFLLGLLTGTTRLGEQLFDSSLQMLRTIPHLALVPLVMLWLGIGEGAKVFLVALGVMFPIYLNTYHGIRQVDPGLLEMARVYGLNRRRMFRRVILPGALPSILVGVRYGLGVMWLTLIVAETIAANAGIGYLATTAREFMQTDIVVLSILLYAALGKTADLAARALERRCLRWHPQFASTATSRHPIRQAVA